jgi:hypothetical protein
MKFESNGKEIVVENGIIIIPGMKEVNCITAGSIIELKDVPNIGNLRDYVRDNKAALKGKVYFGGIFMPREIAEEGKRQAWEIREARSPENRIEGLRELKKAMAEQEYYEDQFDAMMGNAGNDGANPPAPPELDVKALQQKYPRAAAYWDTWVHGHSTHAERILEGEDLAVVLADLEKEKKEDARRFALYN